MHYLKHFQRFIFAVALVVALLLSTLSPAAVFAVVSPTGGETAGGIKQCQLPDGSTGGFQSDGQTCCPLKALTSTDPATTCFFEKYINPAVQLLSIGIGIAITIAIILGAMEYITSAGDPSRAESGKKRITEALIGFIAFVLLYAFLQFIIPGGLIHG